MTKSQFEIHPEQAKKDAISELTAPKAGTDQPGPHLSLGPFQHILVAGYRALSVRRTRRALQDLEPDRLRDISLDRNDLDRTVEEVADQASQAFARRLQGRQRSAGQGTGSVVSEVEHPMLVGRMLR